MKLPTNSGLFALAAVASLATACWVSPRSSSTPTGAPASEASPPADDQGTRVASHKERDLVQPVKIEKQGGLAPIDTGDPNGVEAGSDDGVIGGDLQGVVAAPPPPPPPPPPSPPPNVAPTALEASRIAGEKYILPDDTTKNAIASAGKEKLIGSYKLCITVQGDIKSVNQLKSTGFPAYDTKIMNTIRGEWRYHPFLVNGKPAIVCTAVTFIYSQQLPPSPPPPSKNTP